MRADRRQGIEAQGDRQSQHGALRKSWLLRVTVKGGPVREIGLGSADDITLKEARERAHVVADKVEAAYRRSDLFEKRRQLMQAWARFCASPIVATGEVAPIRKRRS